MTRVNATEAITVPEERVFAVESMSRVEGEGRLKVVVKGDEVVSAVFLHAETEVTVHGFYDGDGKRGLDGSVWKVRFSADELGQWKFVTTSDNFTYGEEYSRTYSLGFELLQQEDE